MAVVAGRGIANPPRTATDILNPLSHTSNRKLYIQLCQHHSIKPNPQTADKLSDSTGDATMTILSLDDPSILLGSKGILPLLEIIRWNPLQKLILPSCGLRTQSVQWLVQGVPMHPTLSYVDLSANALTDAAGKVLVQWKQTNPTIQNIYVHDTWISESFKSVLHQYSPQLPSITKKGTPPPLRAAETSSPINLPPVLQPTANVSVYDALTNPEFRRLYDELELDEELHREAVQSAADVNRRKLLKFRKASSEVILISFASKLEQEDREEITSTEEIQYEVMMERLKLGVMRIRQHTELRHLDEQTAPLQAHHHQQQQQHGEAPLPNVLRSSLHSSSDVTLTDSEIDRKLVRVEAEESQNRMLMETRESNEWNHLTITCWSGAQAVLFNERSKWMTAQQQHPRSTSNHPLPDDAGPKGISNSTNPHGLYGQQQDVYKPHPPSVPAGTDSPHYYRSYGGDGSHHTKGAPPPAAAAGDSNHNSNYNNRHNHHNGHLGGNREPQHHHHHTSHTHSTSYDPQYKPHPPQQHQSQQQQQPQYRNDYHPHALSPKGAPGNPSPVPSNVSLEAPGGGVGGYPYTYRQNSNGSMQSAITGMSSVSNMSSNPSWPSKGDLRGMVKAIHRLSPEKQLLLCDYVASVASQAITTNKQGYTNISTEILTPVQFNHIRAVIEAIAQGQTIPQGGNGQPLQMGIVGNGGQAHTAYSHSAGNPSEAAFNHTDRSNTKSMSGRNSGMLPPQNFPPQQGDRDMLAFRITQLPERQQMLVGEMVSKLAPTALLKIVQVDLSELGISQLRMIGAFIDQLSNKGTPSIDWNRITGEQLRTEVQLGMDDLPQPSYGTLCKYARELNSLAVKTDGAGSTCINANELGPAAFIQISSFVTALEARNNGGDGR